MTNEIKNVFASPEFNTHKFSGLYEQTFTVILIKDRLPSVKL